MLPVLTLELRRCRDLSASALELRAARVVAACGGDQAQAAGVLRMLNDCRHLRMLTDARRVAA